MKKRISILLMTIIVITNSIAYGEIGIEKELRSYILGDFETGEILEEYNINEVVEIASISKLMTYLVVMDEVTNNGIDLDDKIIIDQDTASIRGSTLELEAGEIFSLRELLDASMVVSANDATYALAKYVAGTEENFARMMNKKAMEIGLTNARFYNSTGLPMGSNGIQNIMTTRELFLMSQYIIRNYPEILEISKKPAIEVFSRDFFRKNTNPLLLEISQVDGLKTGFTNKAGYCYVSTFNILGEKDITNDLRLISIVMGTKGLKERNELGKVLVEYGLSNYSNKIFFHENTPVSTMEFPKGNMEEIEVFPREGFSKIMKNGEESKVQIHLDDEIKLPIKKGEKVGSGIVEKNGEEIFQTDIISNEDVKRANRLVLFGRYIVKLYNKIMGN